MSDFESGAFNRALPTLRVCLQRLTVRFHCTISAVCPRVCLSELRTLIIVAISALLVWSYRAVVDRAVWPRAFCVFLRFPVASVRSVAKVWRAEYSTRLLGRPFFRLNSENRLLMPWAVM